MKSKIVLLLVAITLLFALTACDQGSAPAQSGEATAQGSPTVQEIGQGSTSFRFEVTNNDGVLSAWNVSTDEATVGEALLDLGLIDGDMSDWGLFVLEVDGVVADFDANGAWWAFYIDGEMAMVGVDGAEIEEGVVYAFIYTVD
ncbi:MAG: DUF4430 domain-containing protein [Oscillospiraceae bacterium]|nr:DUF4430 domain-containing protein [Oscillospiraceae bacterium]